MLLYIQHFYVSLHTVHAFFAQNKFVMRTGTSGYQFNETFQEDVSLKSTCHKMLVTLYNEVPVVSIC